MRNVVFVAAEADHLDLHLARDPDYGLDLERDPDCELGPIEIRIGQVTAPMAILLLSLGFDPTKAEMVFGLGSEAAGQGRLKKTLKRVVVVVEGLVGRMGQPLTEPLKLPEPSPR